MERRQFCAQLHEIKEIFFLFLCLRAAEQNTKQTGRHSGVQTISRGPSPPLSHEQTEHK